MKYLILGNGWIGNLLKNYLGNEADLFKGKLASFNTGYFNLYSVIINTAAKTNIDWCEKNKNECFEINVIEAIRFAKLCQLYNKKYVFFSSACIFESKNKNDIKYEDSHPNPQCFYAETKWLAERLIQEINPESLILRPRLPLSEVPHPRNTINKLLTYDKINDSQESVTVVEDMIPILISLIKENTSGVYHLINEGTISPAEICDLLKHKFQLVSKEDQNKRLAQENRAKRVTTYVGSKKISLLPNIRERIKNLIKTYNGTNKSSS